MKSFDKWIPMPRFLLRKAAIKDLLSKSNLENKKVLEIGFGAGEMLRWFNARKAQVVGVDFSDSALKMAKERLSDYGLFPEIKLYQNTNEILPSSMDLVCSFEVLEHIKDDAVMIKDWLKLLKPGGVLILSVPAHMSKWNANDVWAGHYRRYEKNELTALFASDQQTVEKLWNYGFPLTVVLDKLLALSKKDEVEKISTDEIHKEALTKKSGTERKNKLIYRVLSSDWALFPFYYLQKLFYNKDIGSGYLIKVKKND